MISNIIILMFFIARTFALYDSDSNVIELTDSNFDSLVINSQQVWIVEFYTPWCFHCRDFVKEYEKAADALKGTAIKVGAVDCEENQGLKESYTIKGFPKVKIFGKDKSQPEDFTGKRTAHDLMDSAAIAVGMSAPFNGESEDNTLNEVFVLDGDNFDNDVMKSSDVWLVAFYMQWCENCKNLIPNWINASIKLKDKAKLGVIDGTEYNKISSKFGITKFPTVKYFPSGEKAVESIVDYDGALSDVGIYDWVMEILNETIGSPTIYQVINSNSLKACDQKSLCIVSILPHLRSCQAKCRNDYLSTLRNVSDKYKRESWGWIWSEAGAQPELEKALEICGYTSYPVLAVVNLNKLVYSVYKDSFSASGITEFLRNVLRDESAEVPLTLSTIPHITNINAWNGEDIELQFSEDLSSVLKEEL